MPIFFPFFYETSYTQITQEALNVIGLQLLLLINSKILRRNAAKNFTLHDSYIFYLLAELLMFIILY